LENVSLLAGNAELTQRVGSGEEELNSEVDAQQEVNLPNGGHGRSLSLSCGAEGRHNAELPYLVGRWADLPEVKWLWSNSAAPWQKQQQI
jgi:hypothetical protein